MSDNNEPAYLIACATDLGEDPDPEYYTRAAPIARKSGFKLLGAGTVGENLEVLEGELPAGTTMVAVEQFSSMQALKTFYFSPEYQSAIPLRQKAAKMNFIVAVPGVAAEVAAVQAQEGAPEEKS